MSALPGQGLKVAIVGGNFGVNVLLPAFRAAGVEVVAVVASTGAKAKLLAEEHNIPCGCSSIDEILNMQIDAIGLAVPPVECERILPTLLDAQIPVFVEKPLGISGKNAKKLANRAQGITTIVDFEFGELRTFSSLRRILNQGSLGHPRFGQVTWLTRSLAQSQGDWSWKTDARGGGGAISMFASQILYLLEQMFGEIVSVSAISDSSSTYQFTPSGESPADESLNALLEFRSGVTFTLLISLVSPSQPFQRWEVAFEKGFVTIDNIGSSEMMDFKMVASNLDGKVVSTETEAGLLEGDSRTSAVASLARKFFTAVKEQTDVQPDLNTGARIQALVDASAR